MIWRRDLAAHTRAACAAPQPAAAPRLAPTSTPSPCALDTQVLACEATPEAIAPYIKVFQLLIR